MEKVLLLVDDEPNILSSLSRLLRDQGYTILTAENADEASEHLAQQTVGVIVCDQNMPETTGIEFLSVVRQTTPNTVRIVLTGQNDTEVVVNAINQGAIYKFLLKPWDDEQFKSTIEDAFDLFELTLKREQLTRDISHAYDDLTEINFFLEEKLAHANQKLQQKENYDNETGLPNRSLCEEKINTAISKAKHTESSIAVIGIDIDRFKLVNDSYGHKLGDQLLMSVAERLREGLGEGYVLSRVFADEFVVLVDPLEGHQEVARHVEKVKLCFAEPFELGSNEIFLCVSMGVSVYPFDGENADQLMKNVVTATHHAKMHGGNQYQYFATEMNDRVSERVSMEADLYHALEREEFVVHYQPQTNIVSGEIIGFEALMRWQHPSKGLVPPVQFIPLLEDIGLINEVGKWLIKHVLRQKQQWSQFGADKLRLAINLSVCQICQDTFLDDLQEILDEVGFDPRKSALEFEVTESMVINQLEQVRCTLNELKEIGARVAVDDFGTGYASLSYLTRLPVNSLKIDRSFVERLTAHEDDRTLAEAIVAMAQSIGLSVIAEGVETQEQLSILKGFGCEEMQGFLYSVPLTAEKFTALLQDNHIGEAGSR